MKNLVKIGVTRLYKNIFFIVCCVLAFLITEWFVSVGPIPQLAKYGAATNAIVVSAGIIFFFALFTGMFFGGERESGILRNQVMAGYSQKEIFFGRYITLLIALAVMNLFWILGAVVGGTKIDAQMLKYIGIEFLYNAQQPPPIKRSSVFFFRNICQFADNGRGCSVLLTLSHRMLLWEIETIQ